MKKVLRVVLATSLVVMLVCVILLLNFTAPNPTGRRYSSEMPLTSDQIAGGEKGKSGERILSIDLGLPNNNDEGQKQCICTESPVPNKNICNVCVVKITPVNPLTTYRIPDFVADTYIAESKNVGKLWYQGTVKAQLIDYRAAALALNRPLWIFTRVNTDVDHEFVELAQSTGGGVVRYFAVPGYIDPVDEGAKRGLLAGSILSSLSLLGLIMPKRTPRASTPKTTPKKWQPADYPDIVEKAKQKAQQTIDEEDSRHGL